VVTLMEIRPEAGRHRGRAHLLLAAAAAHAHRDRRDFLLARHAFRDLGYRRFEWKCNNRNEPSKARGGRFGFVPEGLFRQHMIIKGQNRDTAWFSIIDEEWPLVERAFETRWLDPQNFGPRGEQKLALSKMNSRHRGRRAEARDRVIRRAGGDRGVPASCRLCAQPRHSRRRTAAAEMGLCEIFRETEVWGVRDKGRAGRRADPAPARG
jgi:hypothetical protein